MPEFHRRNYWILLLMLSGLVIFYLPLLVLPFFNHPATDDYFCGLHLERLGLADYQQFVYNHWGGRFAATFTGSLGALDKFIFHNYYAHTLILLLLNVLSLNFLLSSLKIQLQGSRMKSSFILGLSLVVSAVQFSCLAELPTFLFWYSSAITYHLPVILLQFQIGLLLKIINSNETQDKLVFRMNLATSFFYITGFGELFMLVEVFVLSGIYLSGLRRTGIKTFSASVFLFLTSAGIVLASPGLLNRLAMIAAKSPAVGITSVGFQLVQVYWYVFSSPLFWAFAGLVFLSVISNREKLSGVYVVSIRNTSPWKIILALIIFQVFAISMAVMGLKGGLPPLRYLNAVSWISSLSLLFLVFVFALRSAIFISKPISTGLAAAILFIGLVFNNYTRSAYRNMIAAPLYHEVMTEREKLLRRAAGEGEGIVTLPLVRSGYNVRMSKDSRYRFSSIKQAVAEPPEFLFIHDDLEQRHTRKQLEAFYGLEAIIVNR